MAKSSGHMLSFEELKGRSNYLDWKFQMQKYLRHENLWCCIVGYTSDDTTTAEARARRDEKALCKINLMVDKCAFPYVMPAITAKEAWCALERAYEDKGLNRRLRLLRSLCSIKLSNFNKMEEYINEIMYLAQQLASIGKPVEDEFIGAIMLQGLPEEYEPMVMALENSGAEITSDFVKTKLLQDNKWSLSLGTKIVDGAALITKHYKKKSGKNHGVGTVRKMGIIKINVQTQIKTIYLIILTRKRSI